jgi:hypothetical protein
VTPPLERLGSLARTALANDGVEMGVVPMSPAMSTLAEAPEKRETLGHPESPANTLPAPSTRRGNRWSQSWTRGYCTSRW